MKSPERRKQKYPIYFHVFISYSGFLTYIYIVYNVMLYCRLSQLDQLQVLDISNNRALGAVPEVVYNLTQLTELYMYNCGITEISDRYVRVSYTVR